MERIELPAILQQKQAFYTRVFANFEHPLALAAIRLLCTSDYVVRQIKQVEQLLREDDCQQALTMRDYHALAVRMVPVDVTTTAFMANLRHFRHRYLFRLLLRELAGLSTCAETMAQWSDLAEVLIRHTLDFCEQQLRLRYGRPCDEQGRLVRLFVLAMGKLGGRELNISSDIDLIFGFTASGDTDGKESIDNQGYFSKVVQKFVQIMQDKTADGFVFRVDLRLRPNGESGALVCSLTTMEIYYQEQGRDWERYAMVKARLLAEEAMRDEDHWFKRLITPFVYRRYVDFSVIDSLRSMKSMIIREIRQNAMLDNIKNGQGGIREIEFIIQCFQLIRGGRLPQIRHQNAMAALDALAQAGLLHHADKLKQAYFFLRRLENAIQAHNDQQTHLLPRDPVVQTQISLLIGCANWQQVKQKLDNFQRFVSHEFQSVLGINENQQDEKRLIANQLENLWQGHLEEPGAVTLLKGLGFNQPEHCYQMINVFRHSPRCQRLTQAARLRLDRFMKLFLIALPSVPEAEHVLLQVVRLLEHIVGRSAYLALLTENPSALQALLDWFSQSPFITTLLVNHPFLLEELIDQKQKWWPPSKAELQTLLRNRLSHCNDPEVEDEVLRQFKLTCWLIAARAELYGQCHAVDAGRYLANVACVIIHEVMALACARLRKRYPAIRTIKSHFTIIAYGKLGSQEMNYDSDVDLVFLHTANPSEEGMVTRLSQKILHMLTTHTQSGLLYQVDTRLRPSGSAGLLVSHLDAFIAYQRSHAWTWEHQALLKARIIYANAAISQAFLQLKKDTLSLPCDRQNLQQDVLAMRARIDKHSDNDLIKHIPGGLVDLEFLVQFLILAHTFADFASCTNTLAQIRKLYRYQVITHHQYQGLQQAYHHFHHMLHQQLLRGTAIAYGDHQATVLAICKTHYMTFQG